MGRMYLLGEPIFDPVMERKEFFAPAGQTDLCRKILAETQDRKTVIQKLREEYIAIAYSLVAMGIEFRIIYAHEESIDKQAQAVCIKALNCRFIDFRQSLFSNSALVFPRDFCVALSGKIILINSKVATLKSNQKDGYALISSPFGEGGRVLSAGEIMVVSERMIIEDGQSRFVKKNDLKKIAVRGIKTLYFPTPLAKKIGTDTGRGCFFTNDHLDRIGSLLIDQRGKYHLVVDPLIWTAWWEDKISKVWFQEGPEKTMERLKRACGPLGIKVHQPKTLAIPYALNLIQFSDGRVLMTNGDEDVAELVGSLVGKNNLYITPIPIRYHPTWLYAGIRCLIGDAPTPLMKPILQ
ncbi:MAG: hypothetical protein V1690_02825 [Candidatus Moraniibacteriota bacterium]